MFQHLLKTVKIETLHSAVLKRYSFSCVLKASKHIQAQPPHTRTARATRQICGAKMKANQFANGLPFQEKPFRI